MVLMFLRDWRSVIVVVLNIPLAIIASLTALWLAGQSINLMTLGGLALAVGILVDEATVAVENIHTQLERTPSVALAVWRAMQETLVPRLLAMLVHSRGVHSFLRHAGIGPGSVRAAVVGRRLRHGRLVLVVQHVCARDERLAARRPESGYHDPGTRLLGKVVHPAIWLRDAHTLVSRAGLCIASAILIFGMYRLIGTDIFPQVDSGQFQLRLKAPTGTRIEETEQVAKEAVEFIKKEAGEEKCRSRSAMSASCIRPIRSTTSISGPAGRRRRSCASRSSREPSTSRSSRPTCATSCKRICPMARTKMAA